MNFLFYLVDDMRRQLAAAFDHIGKAINSSSRHSRVQVESDLPVEFANRAINIGSHRNRVQVESDLPAEFANRMQHGVCTYRYKGVEAFKCPMDMALYLDVLYELKPGTVIEFGSWAGGSALWLADMLTVMGLGATRVYSYDLKPVELRDPRISFAYCDTNCISDHISGEFMHSLPRPLLIIDDASHNYQQVLNVLRFAHRHTCKGDYIIVEDGFASVVGAEDMHGYEGGPFQATHTFLVEHPNEYEIDRSRCDFYGRNVTWNPDGYIRRIA